MSIMLRVSMYLSVMGMVFMLVGAGFKDLGVVAQEGEPCGEEQFGWQNYWHDSWPVDAHGHSGGDEAPGAGYWQWKATVYGDQEEEQDYHFSFSQHGWADEHHYNYEIEHYMCEGGEGGGGGGAN